jgi:2,3-bisphosphoglycerate-independent phosphoglycerate mutase
MKKNLKRSPLALVILDGWGITKPSVGNAITQAKPLFFNSLTKNYPSTRLFASEEKVGLPRGVFGNSEVGHLNIGAGRVIYQDLLRINQAIVDKTFFSNPKFLAAAAQVKKNKSALHIMGLLSDGRVHSSLDHLFALIDFAKSAKIKNVYIHVFLDGRDTPYNKGLVFVKKLEKKLAEAGVGQIASVSGRFYAMDRDNHWERISKAYQALVDGVGPKFSSASEAVRASYRQKIYDEEMRPALIEKKSRINLIESGDAVIFFNYRADRARELTKALTLPRLVAPELIRGKILHHLYFVAFTAYEKKLPIQVAFPSVPPKNCLGAVLSKDGLKQLRIAETEKYAHVTYFFNGGIEKPFSGEDRILIPSPRVDSYAQQPEMSAFKITDRLIKELKRHYYDFILVNFANADMVGHTGNMVAAEKGIRAVDAGLKKIAAEILKQNGILLVTADHGNADEMYDVKKHQIIKEHSLNPVPFIMVAKDLALKTPKNIALDQVRPSGCLSDIAPTILKLFGLPQPKDMTGRSLF